MSKLIDGPEPYSYTKLTDPSRELRLVTLHPASSIEDPIFVSISHVAFDPLGQSSRSDSDPSSPPVRLPIRSVRESLPQGWLASETSEGRRLFWKNPHDTSYVHPDELYRSSLYQDADDWTPPIEPYEPKYEALSYVWGPVASGSDETIFVEASVFGVGKSR